MSSYEEFELPQGSGPVAPLVIVLMAIKLFGVLACCWEIFESIACWICRRSCRSCACCMWPLRRCCRRWWRCCLRKVGLRHGDQADSDDDTEGEKPPPLPTSVSVDGEDVPLELLRQKKEVATAYALFTVGGFSGLHHFYLERYLHGVLCFISFNFLTFGAVADFTLMRCYVARANRGLAAVAESDQTGARLRWRMGLLGGTSTILFAAMFFFGPGYARSFGVCDLERITADTSANPYEILGVDRDVAPEFAKARYKERLGKLQVLRKCDDECKAGKKDLEKAYDFVGKRPWMGSLFAPLNRKHSQTKRREGEALSELTDEERDIAEELEYIVFLWRGLRRGIARRSMEAFIKRHPEYEPMFGAAEDSGQFRDYF